VDDDNFLGVLAVVIALAACQSDRVLDWQDDLGLRSGGGRFTWKGIDFYGAIGALGLVWLVWGSAWGGLGLVAASVVFFFTQAPHREPDRDE